MNKCIKYLGILIILMAFAATAMPASATPPNPTVTWDTGNFWVNHSWNADTTSATDSYNVSVNNNWDNSTPNRYRNVTVYSAHDWQNITVYAFNNTDGLSTGVQQNTQIPNNAITITNTSSWSGGVGETVYVDYDATPDADGDTPTFSCNRTTDLFTDFDTATGRGNWTAVAGTYCVDFGVSDGWGSSSHYPMTITVNAAATTIPPTPKSLKNTTGKYWVNYEWSEGDGGGDTDGYNVSLNGKWHNITTRSINATNLNPSEWVNISVRAYNKTGAGNLSLNPPLTGQVQAPAPSRGYDTGNRIWEQGMNTSYLWTAQSFTGFYYDIDDGLSTETLTITGIKQSLDARSIEYETVPRNVTFDCSSWGKYDVIGFMAEKYFAGYTSKTKSAITDESISLISNKMLSKVLIDEDDKHMVSTGASLELKEGYEIRIIQLDLQGDQAQIELLRDGKSIDTGIISDTPATYTYTRDLGSVDDVPVVAIRVDSVFAGTESDMLVIKGIFQISENYRSIKTGETYDEMEIKSAGSDGIMMKNDDDIDLNEGDTVDLMGDMKFLVADSSTLRFALYKEILTPGTYDIRGTVYGTDEATSSAPTTWDPMNFEGFYYNIDEDLGTEKLEVKNSGTSIEGGNLIYTTEVQSVIFDCSDWGEYNVIGFMAEKYFAGYNTKTDDDITSDTISLVSNKMLSKVLIDEDDKHMVSTGASLELEEGYEIRIIQLDLQGDKAQIELIKNGRSVDTGIIDNTPATYAYTRDIGKADDVPVVVIRVDSVFAGTESDMLVINGVFQISENCKSVENGDMYGEMKITSTGSGGITMKNDDDIGLNEGGNTMIMGDIGFLTSDGGGARYALFVRRTVGSIAALRIELPESLIVGEEIVIKITADGSPVEGAEVQFAGENLGLTDSDGKVRFTSEEAGTFTITAIKENYDSASEEIRILTEEEADRDPLEIRMPDTVKPGEDVIIKVMYEGDAIEGASVSWDGDYIGDTDETGSLTYTAEDEGTHTVTANKEGYLEGSEEIEVVVPSAEFELTDFTCPEEVSANKNFAVSVDVTNTGDDSGTYLAELKVNGSVVDSQNVTLDAGDTEKIEFTTKIAEAGTNTIEIGTESGEITVTKAKSNTALIAVVLIVLALLGAIGYLLISSAPEGGWTVGRLRDAIKDKFQRGGKGL